MDLAITELIMLSTTQHKAAMECLKFDQAMKSQYPLLVAAPIIDSLIKLDTLSRERLCQKLNISLVMAKEGIPFIYHFMN